MASSAATESVHTLTSPSLSSVNQTKLTKAHKFHPNLQSAMVPTTLKYYVLHKEHYVTGVASCATVIWRSKIGTAQNLTSHTMGCKRQTAEKEGQTPHLRRWQAKATKTNLSAKTPFHAAMEENQLKSKTKQSMAEWEEDKAVHGTAVNGKLGC